MVSGDNPTAIAQKLGVPEAQRGEWVQQLLSLNNTTANALQVDKELKLPPIPGQPQPPAAPTPPANATPAVPGPSPVPNSAGTPIPGTAATPVTAVASPVPFTQPPGAIPLPSDAPPPPPGAFPAPPTPDPATIVATPVQAVVATPAPSSGTFTQPPGAVPSAPNTGAPSPGSFPLPPTPDPSTLVAPQQAGAGCDSFTSQKVKDWCKDPGAATITCDDFPKGSGEATRFTRTRDPDDLNSLDKDGDLKSCSDP